MNDCSFRDQLLGLQQTDAQLQAEHDRRIREMMERDMKIWQKVVAVVVALGGVSMFVGLGYLNLANPQMPLATRAATAATMLFALAWTYLALWTLRRGKITRMHGATQAGLVWAFVLFLFIGTFVQAGRTSDKDFTTWAMLHTVGWLVIGAVFVIVNQIRQSTLITQEEILRLQLRLEKIASSTSQQTSPDSSPTP